ncbi:MAG: DNA mismatch repair endonuclease MutL [Erysipelotrichaceae bacterium]|nr:DNA mismatch repair endonuclease MutL [Erysipelotrichaceae bacterium]
MSRIHELDEHLTNMIAAGEVVEKPMGVVKELVENSLDAGATHIVIRVTDGGRECIEVTDDGCGMDRQDAVMAFNRHATSKIARPEDLWDIHTMGFRGEALPSIASVSKLKMLTSDGSDSTSVEIEYGKITKAGPQAAPPGTTVRVENLFYKTPARLKHLKSGGIELNSIVDLVQEFALNYPQVSFELYSDDRLRLQTNGSGSLEDVMFSVYGTEIASSAIPFEFSDYDFKVSGIAVLPSITRSTRQYINCSVNGRIVRSYNIQKAVIEAYHGLMMPDRYPICVLNAETDFQLVDVNVHPSKWEIRLSKEKQLCELIREKLREVLIRDFRPGKIELPKQTFKAEEKPLFEETYHQEKIQVHSDPVIREEKTEYHPQETEKVVIDRFQYLAQLHGNYILACDADNLYIVDQHAAMERCMYEDICRQIGSDEILTQELLVPTVLELTPVQMQQLDQIMEVFNAIGVSAETFSGNSIIIRQTPLWFQDVNEEEFLKDLIDAAMDEKKGTALEIRKDRIATMACHSSVRFNRKLDAVESRTLLSRLGQCAQPFNCPHGRPTMMSISEQQLEKEFKRA